MKFYSFRFGQTFCSIVATILLLSFGFFGCSQSPKNLEKNLKIEEVVSGLDHPWSLVFLPEGGMLITERSGAIRHLSESKKLSDPLEGLPEVYAMGQGGMLDLTLPSDYSESGWVYISFSEPDEQGRASTAMGRAKFDGERFNDFEVIFRQEPKIDGGNHFGARIVFNEGFVYLTMGERFQFDPAQDLSNHLGTIVRLNPDGSIPADNPFVGQEKVEAEIWSYGHRNIEAAAVDPRTRNLWEAEMGPRDGDELNLVKKGENYGWPEVSWGMHYDGEKIPDPPTRPEFADAAIHWTPVISPSGMDFYTGNLFPEWKNHMLIGGLTAKGIVIVEINGEQAKEVDRIDLGARTREVKQGPDGAIYALTDQGNGKLLKITPGKN
ncbi:MAG: PQQ-dependent sugar dehydrogenase [Cryomorphaceae bacterium]